MTYDVENHGPWFGSWDRHTNVAGLNRLMGSQPPPLNNWVSNGNI